MKRYLFIIIVILLLAIYFLYKNVRVFDTSIYYKKMNTHKNFYNKDNGNNKEKNILVVTFDNRKSDMLDIHNNNVSQYCHIHNYTYIYLDEYKTDLNLPIYWKKIQVVQGFLNSSEYDYVMWMDSDTIILDNNIRIESMINDKDSIYIGTDDNRSLEDQYIGANAGVFIIKNDEYGKGFLNECINNYINNTKCKDKNGNYSLGSKWGGECYEQGVMNYIINALYITHTKILDNFLICNTGTAISGCFILHLYGCGTNYKTRTNAFKKLLKNKDYYKTKISQFLYCINIIFNFLIINY